MYCLASRKAKGIRRVHGEPKCITNTLDLSRTASVDALSRSACVRFASTTPVIRGRPSRFTRARTFAEFTLRVYAHALREEETDLSFLDFGGTKRHPRGTEPIRAVAANRSRPLKPRKTRGNMARREGFEPPTLRFEA